ncbi:hypothetical protein [Pendulispora albinea]|uniref:Outer membrane lipoprotein-sorting protein n=1 Tax=Pendulispora albinea TaxID=2741071 RepID=A0ABZ2M9N8_9BACT
MRRTAAALAALVLAANAGCSRKPVPVVPVSQADWTHARAELAKMRSDTPREPYVELIRVALREPRTGKVIEGRGAVAVDPRRAMRLVLIGPGGRTALDVWVTHDAWRFSVPALDLTRRGDDGKRTYDVPVGFFRWWFLEPLDGRLLSIAPDRRGGRVFVLRDGRATVTLHDLPHRAARASGPSTARHFVAVRREAIDAGDASGEMDVDRLEWVARAVRPGAGDRAFYTQRSTGLQIEIQVEALSDQSPDPAAFVDPDARGLAL